MNPFRIMMLGVGNGFIKSTYHNNALIETQGKLFLLDCGALAWQSLHEIGLGFEDIEGIFITHLHYDHCGGLDEAALYGAYAANRRMKLWVPGPLKGILWDHHLRGTLESTVDGKSALDDYFDVQWVEEGEHFSFVSVAGESVAPADNPSHASLRAQWIQTLHVPSKFSCSLILDNRLFYSSDMQPDKELLNGLFEKGIETFYHEACFGRNAVHSAFEELCKYPEDIRRRMYLMHYGEAPGGMTASDLQGMHLLRQHEWLIW
jgi:ribonuclease BN (tRNA processing enzyme)